jgi:catechol 2,3-dioxygenase-like lactoylglutathione lyase family enzyme
MKHLFMALVVASLASGAVAQSSPNPQPPIQMKLNAGILTAKLAETKQFYTQVLGFGVSFENEFYLLLHTPGHGAELSFLLPEHPSQQPFFQAPFLGQGMYLTIEVDNVDEWYEKLRRQGVAIKVELRSEPWGDRHFAIADPNGIGIDLVQYTPPPGK